MCHDFGRLALGRWKESTSCTRPFVQQRGEDTTHKEAGPMSAVPTQSLLLLLLLPCTTRVDDLVRPPSL